MMKSLKYIFSRIKNSKFRIQNYLLILLFLPLFLFSQDDYRQIQNNTFQRGEILKYRVFYDSWMTYWMTAGFGITEIEQEPVFMDGRETYHIIVKGNTVGVFNLFFKVRDRFESFVDKEGLMPLKFTRSTREGSFRKKDEVLFDHQGKIATSTRNVKSITPYVQDIVSAFYYMRTWDFDTAEVNDIYKFDFFLDDSLPAP